MRIFLEMKPGIGNLGKNQGLEEKGLPIPGIQEFCRNDQRHAQVDVP